MFFTIPTSNRPCNQPSPGTTAKAPRARSVKPKTERSSTARTSSPSPGRGTTTTTGTPGTRPVLKSSYSPTQMAERYANRAFNRQPSPTGRFPRPKENQRPKKFDERPRERKVFENRSTSNLPRPRLLESCRSSRPRQVPVEPKRSESNTTSRKVLTAVKEVLSKAVIERGRIDEDNLGTVIKNMKGRLFGEDSEDEGSPGMDVEGKESMMTVNIEVANEKPIIGIVRRPVDHTPQKTYNKVYRARSPSAQRPEEDEIVYINLPDVDGSNFNSLIRKEANRRSVHSELGIEDEEKYREREVLQEDESPFDERLVGDCPPVDLHKAAEDAKLQRYIEKLLRNMNDQLNARRPCEDIEAETEYKSSICKSFCVCKVCLSSNPSTKRVLRGCKLNIEGKSDNDDKTKRSVSSEVEPNTVKLKSPLAAKRTTTSSNFKVVKATTSMGSRANTPRPRVVRAVAMEEVTPKGSYTVVESGQTVEVADDMYMRRRIRSPARTR